MRLVPFALVALALTGCASTRHQPGTLPPPATLAEVNQTLERQRATVYFADGRAPARLYVLSVGPEVTLLSELGGRMEGSGRRYEWVPDRAPQAVPTDTIARIEIDDSMSAGEGALRGAGTGSLPGLGVAGMGLVGAAGCDGSLACGIGTALVLGGGLAGAVVGAGIGGVTGAVITSRRYPVTVYEAPVTRYPDAALAILRAAPEAAARPAASR